MNRQKIKEIFSKRADKLTDHDPWRYGEKLSLKCDSIELDWIYKNINHGKIIDLGCGTGRHLINLALSFPDNEFAGLDLAENNIKILQKKAKKYPLSIRVEALDALDFEKLDFGPIDTAIGVGLIQYIDEKPLKVLVEKLYYNLSKGGVLLFKIPISFKKTYLYEGYSEFLQSEYISKYRTIDDTIEPFNDHFDIIKMERVFDESQFDKNFNIIERTPGVKQMWFKWRKK